jgi:hypothetical protein
MRKMLQDWTCPQMAGLPTDHYHVVLDCLSDLFSEATLMGASLWKARMFPVRKTLRWPPGSHKPELVERTFNGKKMKFYEILYDRDRIRTHMFTYRSFIALGGSGLQSRFSRVQATG